MNSAQRSWPFSVRPLTVNLGAEIIGVKLSEEISDELFLAIYEAFLRYQVLLFPPQDLPLRPSKGVGSNLAGTHGPFRFVIESGPHQTSAGGEMIGKSVDSVVSDKQIRELIAIPASATVSEAVSLMSQKGVGAVLIRNPNGNIDGIFTERDLMIRVVNAGRDPANTPIGAVMSPQVRRVEGATTIEDALSLMVVHGYRHLLVEDAGRLKGMVSLRDFMASMVKPDVPIAHEGRVGVTRSRAEATLRVVAALKPENNPER